MCGRQFCSIWCSFSSSPLILRRIPSRNRRRPKMSLISREQKILRILKKLFPKAGMVLHFSNPWECMVAVQLSAQCTDKKVNEVTPKLFKKYKKLEDYIDANPAEFDHNVRQITFHRN